MTRTAIPYIETLLEERWTPNIDGRIESVPQPQIIRAAERENTRVNPRNGDILFIKDGGSVSQEPRSVGWTHRRSQPSVTLDFRTAVDRGRLEGYRDENNDRERYGGLRGEAQRILDTVRRGDKEFDWINGYEYRPLSEEIGHLFWRGALEVRLTEIAEEIDPEP